MGGNRAIVCVCVCVCASRTARGREVGAARHVEYDVQQRRRVASSHRLVALLILF